MFQEELSAGQKETPLLALYSHCFGFVSGGAEPRAEGDGVAGDAFAPGDHGTHVFLRRLPGRSAGEFLPVHNGI